MSKTSLTELCPTCRGNKYEWGTTDGETWQRDCSTCHGLGLVPIGKPNANKPAVNDNKAGEFERVISIHPRSNGEMVRQLITLHQANKNGESMVIVAPWGQLYTEAAHQAALAARDAEWVGAVEEVKLHALWGNNDWQGVPIVDIEALLAKFKEGR